MNTIWCHWVERVNTIHTPYSAHMSPEKTNKLMVFYMEVVILDVIL